LKILFFNKIEKSIHWVHQRNEHMKRELGIWMWNGAIVDDLGPLNA
jgi:hypothetical protein